MNVSLIKRVILIVSLLIPIQAYGQEQLNLSDAIQKALDNNYNISVIKLTEEITQINNSWGAAGRYPTVNFGLSSNNKADFNETTDYVSNGVNPSINLNWMLFNGFSIKINKQRLETLSELSQGNTTVVVENTIQAVIIAYYRALLEKETLEVVREVMELSEDRYNYMKMKKELGSAVTFDVLQAKNSWLEDKSQYLLQKVSYNNTIRDLNYLMGIKEDVSYLLTGEFDALPKKYDHEDLHSRMLENNKTLKNQYINLELLKKEIELSKTSYYPSVSLNSGVDSYITRVKYDGLDAQTVHTHNYYANLSLTFRLIRCGKQKKSPRNR